MPGRSYTAGSAYRYGFNGKENDKDISEGGQDYGMRIYDSRLGRFLSVDPITAKYPELTPYQFASNRPIDGIDLDGLEFMKYDATFKSAIVFNRKEATSDEFIKQEYANAMKANMNVVLANDVGELNKYFEEKKIKNTTLLFSGHGIFRGSAIKMAGQYSKSQIEKDKKDFIELGKYVDKNGTIILLACFQATPESYFDDVNYSDVHRKIYVNGQALCQKISELTNSNVLASAAEVRVAADEFNGGNLDAKADPNNPPVEFPVNDLQVNSKFCGQWTMFYPDKSSRPYSKVKINSDGSFSGNFKIFPSDIKDNNMPKKDNTRYEIKKPITSN